MLEHIKNVLDGIYVKDIVPYIVIGIVLYFVVSRPLETYKAREYCKQRYGDELPKLKWYEWWL